MINVEYIITFHTRQHQYLFYYTCFCPKYHVLFVALSFVAKEARDGDLQLVDLGNHHKARYLS